MSLKGWEGLQCEELLFATNYDPSRLELQVPQQRKRIRECEEREQIKDGYKKKEAEKERKRRE